MHLRHITSCSFFFAAFVRSDSAPSEQWPGANYTLPTQGEADAFPQDCDSARCYILVSSDDIIESNGLTSLNRLRGVIIAGTESQGWL